MKEGRKFLNFLFSDGEFIIVSLCNDTIYIYRWIDLTERKVMIFRPVIANFLLIVQLGTRINFPAHDLFNS